MFRKLLPLIFLILVSTSLKAQFQSDIILTSPNGLWTDSRAYSTLNDAITAVGANERTIVIASQQTVTDLTVPSNVTLRFEKNGSIANSGTLTLQTKNITAPNRQIFTGVGEISFASGSELLSGWFANFESALALTSTDTVTLVVSKAQTITASFAIGNNVQLKWDAPGNILTVNAGKTISNIKSVEGGNYQLFAGAGTFTFVDGINLNLRWFNSLRSAITWISTTRSTLSIPPAYVVDLDETIPSNIILDFINLNGSLSINAGITVTHSGLINAQPYKIFEGLGSIVFSGSTYNVVPQWWGAIVNDAVDDTTYINTAFASAKNVLLPDGTYVTSAALNVLLTDFKLSSLGQVIITPTHIVGNVIYIHGASAVKNVEIGPIKIRPTTGFAANTLTGIYNDNGQHIRVVGVDVIDCGAYNIYNKYDSNSFIDIYSAYSPVAFYNTYLGNAVRIVRGKYEQATTAISINDGAGISIEGFPVVQSNTVGIVVNSTVGNNYNTHIDAYFEDNATDLVVAGTSASHMVYGLKVSGYLNHSNAAAPCVTLAYADNPLFDNFHTISILNNEDWLSYDTGNRGLSLRNVTQEAYPYISSQTGIASINGVMSPENITIDGGFEKWSSATTLDKWTLSSATVAQETTDIREGSVAVEGTAAGASAAIYQDYVIPTALLGKTVPFIVVGDMKVTSGTGAVVQASPIDNAGTSQGVVSTKTSTSASWVTVAGRPGLTNSSATKIRIILRPDVSGVAGVSLFDRIGVYFGSTPYTFIGSASDGVIYRNSTYSAYSEAGTTSMATAYIGAGQLKLGDMVRIIIKGEIVGTNGNKTIRVQWDGNSTATGAYGAADVGTFYIIMDAVITDTTTADWIQSVGRSTTEVIQSNSGTIGTIASAQNITFNITLAHADDEIRFRFMTIEKK